MSEPPAAAAHDPHAALSYRATHARPPLATLLLSLAAVHLAVWALAAARIADPLLNHQDSLQYLAQAMNIRLHGSWYAGPWDAPHDPMLLSIRPPLYAYVLAAVLAVSRSPLAMTLLQCALSVVTLAGIARALGDYAVMGRRRAWIAAALIVCPSQLVYANTIMAELLVQAAIVWAFLAYRAWVRTARPLHLVLAALALAAGAWLKPVLVAAWAPFLALIAVRVARRVARPAALLAGLIPLAAVLALALAQGARTGSVHYSSLPAYNLLTYNLPQLLARRMPEAEAWRRINAIDSVARAQPTLGARLATVEHAGARAILADPLRYAALQLRGMAVFMLDPGRFDVAQFLRLQPVGAGGFFESASSAGVRGVGRTVAAMPKPLLAYLLVVAIAHAVLALCFFVALGDARIEPPVRGMLAGLVGYVWLVTGTIGAARFRVPIEPLLLFALPFGLERLLSAIGQRRPYG